MRPVRLVRIALSAEALRLRHHLRRAAIHAVVGGIATAALLTALVFAHIAAWGWLRESLTSNQVALIFAGADLVLAVVLAILALHSRPGAIEREARALRERALDDAADTLTLSTLVLRLIEMLTPLPPRE